MTDEDYRDYGVTWTDADDVTHAWANVHNYPGTATTMCDGHIDNAFTRSNTIPAVVTCLACIANVHGYKPFPHKMARLGLHPFKRGS